MLKREKKNTKIIQNLYYPRLFDAGELEIADQIIHPEFFNDSHPNWPHGPEGIKRVVRMLHAALDNLHMDIEHIMAEGNHVIVWSTQSGVWKGTNYLFGVLEPAGTIYRQKQAHLFMFDRGKIVKHEVIRDDKETRVNEHGKILQT